MRLTVLGSGTGVPSGTRASSGHWLEVGGGVHIRLDCGPGTVHAMARWALPWEALTHQWVSHFHVDHALEIPALLFAFKYGRGERPAPRGALKLIGPAGLRRLVGALAEAFRTEMLEQDFPVEVVEVEAGQRLDIGGGAGAIATFAKTPHTDESLALRVEAGGKAFGYTGDTAPSDALARFFGGVDLLLAECSFVEDARGTLHLRAPDAAALATAASAKHLVAVHAYFDPEAERLRDLLARGFRGEITVARDGASFEI